MRKPPWDAHTITKPKARKPIEFEVHLHGEDMQIGVLFDTRNLIFSQFCPQITFVNKCAGMNLNKQSKAMIISMIIHQNFYHPAFPAPANDRPG